MNIKTIHLFFFLFAILIKIIAIKVTNFDLFGDEAQYWIWSQKLDYGYYSKPPFMAWVIKFYSFFIGNSFISLKIIPISFYVFTSFAIYFLSFELYRKKGIALITALSFYLIPAVSVSSFLLSTDIVLVFLWTLSLILLLKIIKKPDAKLFILMGFLVGFALLTKYAAIYFFLSFIIFLIIDKKTRKLFYKNYIKVFFFILTFIAVFLPNLIWNFKNGWITFNHTSDNAALDRINFNILQGFEFILSQAFMLGPLLFCIFIFTSKKILLDFNTKFLLSFSIPIFIIVTTESILVRSNANWAAVALISIYILIVHHVYLYSKKIILLNSFINFLFCIVFFILIAQSSTLVIFDRINGITKFSLNLKKNFSQETQYLVIEDRLLYSNISYIFRDLDKIILTPYNPSSQIKSHFHLTKPLKQDFNSNFLYIGSIESINYLSNKPKKISEKNKIKTRFKKNPIKIYEVSF